MLLSGHPRIAVVSEGDAALTWEQGGWRRSIAVGHPATPLYGLIELVDNNPLVCADEFSVPSAAATLALIALGPLAAAGMIVERPTLLLNASADEIEVDAALAQCGWPDGVVVHTEAMDLGTVVAATAMAEVPTPDDPTDIADIYEERFGRSFFVRQDQTSEWDAPLVAGKPYALYRVSVGLDEPRSLVTIRVLADLNGKLGAAQIIHAMNVMSGFEESLGIE